MIYRACKIYECVNENCTKELKKYERCLIVSLEGYYKMNER